MGLSAAREGGGGEGRETLGCGEGVARGDDGEDVV